MTVEALDPRVALIIIDLQKGTVGNPLVHPVAEVVAHSVELLSAFHRKGLPVVLAHAAELPSGRTEYSPRKLPAGWSELIPELDPQPSDITVTKTGWGAFTGTNLNDQLKRLGVTQLSSQAWQRASVSNPLRALLTTTVTTSSWPAMR